MDTNNNGQAPATDDQELAQVLAGMNQQVADQPADDQPVADQPASDADGMQFEETGAVPTPPTLPEAPAEGVPVAPEPSEPIGEVAPEVAPAPEVPAEEPVIASLPEPAPVAPVATAVSPELESIKKDALEQLRPLVDKLDLEPQEKFDTLLLIIRSTDDQSLVAAANEAAKAIQDDAKRAEALLDVIKEIDFFSHPAQ